MRMSTARGSWSKWVMAAAAGCGLLAGQAGAQTQPAAVPVPFVTAAAGNGSASTPSTACTSGFVNTDNAAYGDGCPAAQASFSSPQGAAVDKYGNLYIGDYSHRQVRVVYNGGAQVAAAIVAANAGFTPSTHALPSFTPTVGNVYTLAGTGLTTTALTANASGTYPCANNAASASAGFNSLGDGCPGAGAVVGPRDVKVDSDGNLFITDYTDSRIRVLCVNCAAGTQAAALITLENVGVTPVNGALYTVVGFTTGYRDQAPGYSSTVPGAVSFTTATSVSVALLRTPSSAVVSSNDDVYIADNLNNALRVLYNGGTAAKNILTAEGYTPVVGNVYTIAGSGCVSAATGKTGQTASANSCLTTAGTDTPGLGTVPGSSATAATSGVGSGVVWSVYLDANGNVYYTDVTNARVKVIYGGIAAPLTFAGTMLQAGYTYSFAGQGTAAVGTVNGVPPSQIAFTAGTGAQGVGGDANGNIFTIDYGNGLFYETYAQTGITAIIVGGGAQATLAKGANCNGGSTGPVAADAAYNGCPGTQAKLSNPRGPVVADSAGNLYFGDSVGYFIRRFSYSPTFPATAVASTATAQSYAFGFLSAQTLTAPTFAVSGGTSSEFSDAGGDTCAAGTAAVAGAPGTTCVFNVAFTPARPGLRAGSLLLNSASGVLGEMLFSGVGTGAGLTVDPGTSTTTGTGLTPNGIAVDGAGRVLVSDAASKNVLRYTSGTPSIVASGFTTPTGVAVDGAGNIFVADSSANTVSEIPVVGGAKFTLSSAVRSPRGLATDGLGNLYIADSGNNRVLLYGPGATTPTVMPFIGLSAPLAVAVDANNSVYAADGTHIVRLSSLGVQSTVASGSAYTGLAVDAAGNVLATTATALLEYPASGAAAITLSSSFTAARSLALDASGNAFLADSGVTGFIELQRTAGFLKFTSPSSAPVFLSSSGNIALSAPTFTQTDSTNFSLVPATTNGCSGALAAGTQCALTASFTPTTAGTLNDGVTVGSNATNGSPITILLTGTTSAQATTTSVSVSPATLVYGNVETLTATVTGALQTPSSGTVNFYNNGSATAFASAGVTNGQATYSFVPAVGSYSVTATYVPSGLTYSASSTTAAKSFSVTPATLTVTANNASKTFGSANPAFTYSVTGFVNNDTQSAALTGAPTETTTATTTSSVGQYPITITQGTLAAANYAFTFVNGTLTVSGSTAQTITFAALPNVNYGVGPITLTATASSSLAVSYTVTGPATVSGSTLTITGAGPVSVTASQTGNNTYAAAPSVTQSFTVAKAALTVTATNVSRTYGAANPTLTYTVGGFVNADTQTTATTGAPVETTTATASSGVGQYPITITQGTLAAANYTFSFSNGTLTVNPATLTLTAASASRPYGTANPTFSGTLSGAVNNDTLTETFTTTATVSSPAGTYAIVPGVSGTNAANYTISATNGTLTVTQLKPGITLIASPSSGFNGSTTITLTATVSAAYGTPTGMVTFYSGVTSLGQVTLTNGVATLSVTTLPVGPDSITAVYSGDTNFATVTSLATTVTIAAGFSAASSSTTFTFPSGYQEAQAFLTVNPGGRTDTISFACVGLPAKITCAFNPSTLPLSGLTTAQTVQVLVSNSNAHAALREEPAPGRASGRSLALATLPLAGLLLLGLRRRRSLPTLMPAVLLSAAAALALSGCGTSPADLKQTSGTYNFTINVNSGTTTLQSIPCTLSIP